MGSRAWEDSKKKSEVNMNKLAIPLLAAALAALVGCVSPHVNKPAPTTVDLSHFHRVKLTVTDEVHSSSSQQAVPMFAGLLRGRLADIGYEFVEANPEMILEVRVNEFDEGDRALRFLVSFGAGRAVMKFTADFKDPSGNLLAELEGGKSYTGLELNDNALLKSDESTRMGMVSYPVSQIARFIEANGRTQ
jgi:hypothetical protein